MKQKLPGLVAHPSCHRLPHALLEGQTEGAVTAVATFTSKLLGGKVATGSGGLVIEADEVLNAQIVDISIVSHVLS